MHRSHVAIQDWFWAAYLVATHTPGISALQLRRQLGISSHDTAWYMLQRLRKGMVNESRSKLTGLVEADETIIGGPAKGRPGRGSARAKHKSLVIGAVEVRTYIDKNGKHAERAGRLRLAMIEHAEEETIKGFACSNIEAGATIRTDGWKGYSETALAGFNHKARIQGDPERAHKLAPHIHRVFGNLKTWLNGTHHGVDPKYLPAYLDEYVFRFNRRNTPMAAFQTLLGISTAKAPITLDELR